MTTILNQAFNLSSPLFCHLNVAFGLIKVSGPDAKKLLQGQLSCDLNKIDATHASLGAQCTPKGRIISLFYLFEFREAYYLLLPRSMLRIGCAQLKKYAVFYKVTISADNDHLGIIGYSHPTFKVANPDVAIINLSERERHILVTDISNQQTIYQDLKMQACIEVNAQEWKQQDIHAKIPAIYPETSEKFLPHDLNLTELNAIDFNKGCYTGQEIIARMEYRGKLKTHLYRATIKRTALPTPGLTIASGSGAEKKDCGYIVDACALTQDDIIALIVTNEENAKQNHLYIADDENTFFMLQETFETNP